MGIIIILIHLVVKHSIPFAFFGVGHPLVDSSGDDTRKAAVVHSTAYDGTLERACLKLEIPVLSVTDAMICYNYTLQSISNFLLEEWKGGSGEIGKMLPKFEPNPSEHVPDVDSPSLHICQIENKTLVVPPEIRSQWLGDPIRAVDWKDVLKKFDQKWTADAANQVVPVAPSQQVPAAPNPADQAVVPVAAPADQAGAFN